jgi:hypothetical protein
MSMRLVRFVGVMLAKRVSRLNDCALNGVFQVLKVFVVDAANFHALVGEPSPSGVTATRYLQIPLAGAAHFAILV